MFDPTQPQAYSDTVKIEPTFFGKVMTFFSLGMLATAGGAYAMMLYGIEFLIANPLAFYGMLIAEFGLILSSGFWGRKEPLNRFLYILFTVLSGATLAPLLSSVLALQGGADILIKALLTTGLMFAATAVFGATTRINLSGMRGFLLMGLIGLIIVSIIGFFIAWNNDVEILFSGFGVVLFSGFTMYHIQEIKQARHNDYIGAAISLYLSIFNLFMSILRLLLALNRN